MIADKDTIDFPSFRGSVVIFKMNDKSSVIHLTFTSGYEKSDLFGYLNSKSTLF